MKADYIGRSCEKERCNLRSILLTNGSCQQCPNFQRPVTSVSGCGKLCQPANCADDEIVTFDGVC